MSARSRRLVLSARARVDLSDILLYTERHWGRQQMRTYNRSLTEAFAELKTFPHLGRLRPDYGQDFRGYIVGQHAIIYKVTETEVIVVRLLHMRRDADSQLETATEE